MSEGFEQRVSAGRPPISGYIGFDASARSLHVGNLVQVFMLTHLQRAGGTPYVVIGGGTGMIGDPSGKSSERNLLDDEQIASNSAAIRAQLERFIDFSSAPNQAQMVDNRDWLTKFGLLEFLRDIGKHFSVPYMLAKESGPGPPRAWAVVHRVLVHDPAGGRLAAPVPEARRRTADGRRRPMGQSDCGPGADQKGCRPGGRGGATGVRPVFAAVADQVGREDGQVGEGCGLPRWQTDFPIRLLPVLAERRRRAGGPAPALANADDSRSGGRPGGRTRTGGRRADRCSALWPST